MKRARGERRLVDDCQSRRRRRRRRRLLFLGWISSMIVLVEACSRGPRFLAWLRRQNKNQGQIKPRRERRGGSLSLLLLLFS